MTALLDQGFEEMGVPVEPVRPTLVASRAPSLIGTAHAATLNEVHGATLNVAHATAAKPAPAASGWGVQVGSYATERVAQETAQSARRAAEAGEVRIERVTAHGVTLWRAQVVRLTAARAQGACGALAHGRTPCAVLRPEPGQVASR
jgi:hypothetical protein